MPFSLISAENPKFVETLRDLESSPICQSLAMHSFLMLPMQRVTRLPLLVEAIYKGMGHSGKAEKECQTCKGALETINKVGSRALSQ
jgi:neuronal guanine nucleotide exchange factor